MPSLNSPPYKIHKRFLSGHFDSYITYVLVLSIYDKTRKRDWSPKDLKREELIDWKMQLLQDILL